MHTMLLWQHIRAPSAELKSFNLYLLILALLSTLKYAFMNNK